MVLGTNLCILPGVLYLSAVVTNSLGAFATTGEVGSFLQPSFSSSLHCLLEQFRQRCVLTLFTFLLVQCLQLRSLSCLLDGSFNVSPQVAVTILAPSFLANASTALAGNQSVYLEDLSSSADTMLAQAQSLGD